jgi:UDPglucose 6-dehydrogenase
LRDADALLIVTEWKQYRVPDFKRMRDMMRRPLVIDGRNLFEANRLRELGFDYMSIGRPSARPAAPELMP